MTRKRTSSSRLARHAVEIVVAAPQVIAVRTARMVRAGAAPTARDRREFERMHKEKIDAFADGWRAMWGEALRIQQRSAISLMGAWWKPASTAARVPAQWSRDALAILCEGIAPVRNRAVANAKRLAKPARR